MDRQKIELTLKSLQGVSYHDWQKIKMSVDEEFRKKEIKHKRELVLDSCDGAVETILQQFGCKLD